MDGLFPRFVNHEVEEDIVQSVSPGELEGTLKWFRKDKSSSPDGWLVVFYLAFFEVLGNDLLQVIKECRASGRMYDAFNFTFIALIPKSDDPKTINDF